MEDAMSKANVEERLTALERTVAELVQSARPAGRVKDWPRTKKGYSR
jgi:hypothetical protein